MSWDLRERYGVKCLLEESSLLLVKILNLLLMRQMVREWSCSYTTRWLSSNKLARVVYLVIVLIVLLSLKSCRRMPASSLALVSLRCLWSFPLICLILLEHQLLLMLMLQHCLILLHLIILCKTTVSTKVMHHPWMWRLLKMRVLVHEKLLLLLLIRWRIEDDLLLSLRWKLMLVIHLVRDLLLSEATHCSGRCWMPDKLMMKLLLVL